MKNQTKVGNILKYIENKSDWKLQLGMPLKMCNNWCLKGVSGKLLVQLFAAVKMPIIS